MKNSKKETTKLTIAHVVPNLLDVNVRKFRRSSKYVVILRRQTLSIRCQKENVTFLVVNVSVAHFSVSKIRNIVDVFRPLFRQDVPQQTFPFEHVKKLHRRGIRHRVCTVNAFLKRSYHVTGYNDVSSQRPVGNGHRRPSVQEINTRKHYRQRLK